LSRRSHLWSQLHGVWIDHQKCSDLLVVSQFCVCHVSVFARLDNRHRTQIRPRERYPAKYDVHAPKPKGQEDSAQGFNQVETLGRVCHQAACPERAQERIHVRCSLDRNYIRLLAIPNLPPFQGGSLLLCVDPPGLKPWAEFCRPFGTSLNQSSLQRAGPPGTSSPASGRSGRAPLRGPSARPSLVRCPYRRQALHRVRR
jgi:hypothetical protein